MALQSSLETLEMERKARSEVDQEVLALRGRVMGTEEANTRLCAQAARPMEKLSALENSRHGMYLFYFSLRWFLSSVCLACLPSSRAGWIGEDARAGPRDDQGDP